MLGSNADHRRWQPDCSKVPDKVDNAGQSRYQKVKITRKVENSLMSSNSALERTISKVLSQKEAELISQVDTAYQESLNNVEGSKSKLEAERTRIIESAKKQA